MKMERRMILALFIFFFASSSAADEGEKVAEQMDHRIHFKCNLSGDEYELAAKLALTISGQAYFNDKFPLGADFIKVGKDQKIWWNGWQNFPQTWAANSEGKIVGGGKEFKDPLTGMEFILVRGGCFEMGDTFGNGNADEEPVHEVCVSDFYMGKYEATQEQWEKVMGSNPSSFRRGGNYPVENISWYEVQEFIRRLNQKNRVDYRLPTEAEWEYAARSRGKKEKWAGTSSESDLDDFAWIDRNSGEQTHPVGQKKPNSLGLFDMTGNVWEWVADWYDEDYYKITPSHDPIGPTRGDSRVLRGGSWISMPGDVRASLRARGIPSVRGNLGVRLAFSPR
ncbi:MAG: formylglycine-generating enzyme family protein [Deltaproteobacteria bacterium]|nr:formylglycine-generating enzyme family protein [Deltaproteobacteria bacterium]